MSVCLDATMTLNALASSCVQTERLILFFVCVMRSIALVLLMGLAVCSDQEKQHPYRPPYVSPSKRGLERSTVTISSFFGVFCFNFPIFTDFSGKFKNSMLIPTVVCNYTCKHGIN